MHKPAGHYLEANARIEVIQELIGNFPPPPDYVLSLDSTGQDLSHFGDDYWDFRAYKHGATFNFGKRNLSDKNKLIAKNGLILSLLHPALFPGRHRSAKYCYYCLVRIAEVCDKNNVLMNEIDRFPKVQLAIAHALKGGAFRSYINFLHRLRIYGQEYGYELMNERSIAHIASQEEKREVIQTAYIPPRIWHYQLNRLDELLDDFLHHQEAIGEAFDWVAKAYQANSRIPRIPRRYIGAFQSSAPYSSSKVNFGGSFSSFLDEYGLKALFSKWMEEDKLNNIKCLTGFFSLMRDASLLYVLNFSLQRNAEVTSLHSDCFLTEMDENLGIIAMIVGETTKTDEDSDARWVVPITVKKAIDIATWIAQKRFSVASSGSGYSESSLPLAMAVTEPWGGVQTPYHQRTVKVISHMSYSRLLENYPKVLNAEEIRINQEDWRVALSITPNLVNDIGFAVGQTWPLAPHQLRRTTCVNMFSSSMVSDSSLQYQMKHLNRGMTYYYGRNNLNLRLNTDAQTSVIVESYKSIYRNLADIIAAPQTYVRPHKHENIPKHIINLVNAKEEKKLIKLIKQGAAACRPTLLGYCLNPGPCVYGGIESISKCTNAGGGAICADAIFDKKNKEKLIKLKTSHMQTLDSLDPNSPRSDAIKKEIYAIGVYLDVIQR